MLEKSIFNLKKIFLVLGTACNFNCVYCVQHENKPRCKKTIKQEVLDWLDNIAYRLPKTFKPKLHFYGGEPLLYKESIKQVVDLFGDKFKYIIVSNGSYLTPEDVDYYNNNDIYFVLSNDGENTEYTRQVDMLKSAEFVKLFKQIKHRGVDAVYSAKTQDLHKLHKYVNDIVPDTNVWIEDLTTNSSTPEDLACFDIPTLLNDYKKMGDSVDKYYTQQEDITSEGKQWIHWLVKSKGLLSKPEFGDFPNCGIGKHNLSVDTQGNIYLCKNFNEKIGTVANTYDELYENAKVLIRKLHDKNLENKGCFDCSAFYFCRGGCPFEEGSDIQKKKCDMIRTKWASVVSYIDNRLEIVKQ